MRDDVATMRLNYSAMSRLAAQRLTAPSLDPGLVLAERFTIVRFIARGGMGEVYEALDLELNEPVALKTIRPDIAEDPMALSRFKREIQLARKVTHPNVSRIFDIFNHRWPSGGLSTASGQASGVAATEDERLTFLTMELLAGETLHDRLRRDGRMAPAAALVIVEQMVAALGAAHAAGVVHRDFKSANVILVPATAPGEPVRAVVTDFGLAYSGGASGSRTALTTYGDTLGTPDYMAPEQVIGGAITNGADIYALGVVLYEMVTAQLPFTSESPLTTAVRRLSEPPPSPRLHVADLDPVWEAVILRCLERNPADRYPSVGDVLKALSGGVVTESQREGQERRRRQQRTIALAGGAVAILVAGILAVRYLPGLVGSRPAAPTAAETVAAAPAVKPRQSVAVLGFKNRSGGKDSEWLSTALAEMLTTELGAGEKLRLMSGETVARVKADLALGDAESYPPETLARIRANFGTDLVVAGAYLVSGNKVRVDLRVQDALSGDTMATVEETAAESELIDLVSRVGTTLRGKLGLSALSASDARSAQSALPANPEAARLYAEGLAKLRVFDALAAKGLLGRAVIADEKHALAHSALAAAWASMGYDAAAREEAKKAFDLSANLSREDRYVVEARYQEAAQQWDEASATYSKLFSFFSDNLDYGLRLATSQTTAGKGRDALATLDALRKLPPPARDDPRIDLTEAEAARSLSDFTRERKAAAAAAAKGTKTGARLLVGNARLAEGWACRNLGQLGEASAALEDAKSIFVSASDTRGVARAVNYQGLVLKEQGELGPALEMFERALAIRRNLGDMGGVAASMMNIATIHLQRGNPLAARDMYSQALETYTTTANRLGIAQTQQNLGRLSFYQGDLPGARKIFESALATYREIGNKNGEADTLNSLAAILLRQGDPSGARPMFEAALRIQREIGQKSGIATAQTNLGLALLQSQDYPGAATQFGEALAIYRELNDPVGVTGALINSGIGLEQQGKLGEAKKAFSDAVSANGSRADALTAQSRLGQVLMLQGDLPAARTTYEEALAAWQQAGETRRVAQTRTALARIALEDGRVAEAEGTARMVATEMAALKLPDDEAMALDVLARALLAEGKAAEAAKVVARAQALPPNAVSQETRLASSITRGRVAAATGQGGSAAAALAATLVDATRIGSLPLQFDARLALGELELKSGKASAGAARLQVLERDAKASAFGLFARRAAAARGASNTR